MTNTGGRLTERLLNDTVFDKQLAREETAVAEGARRYRDIVADATRRRRLGGLRDSFEQIGRVGRVVGRDAKLHTHLGDGQVPKCFPRCVEQLRCPPAMAPAAQHDIEHQFEASGCL